MEGNLRFSEIKCNTRGCPNNFISSLTNPNEILAITKEKGWKQNNFIFTCPACSNMFGGAKGACLAIQIGKQSGIAKGDRPSDYTFGVGDGISAFKIFLDHTMTLGRFGHPDELSNRGPGYIPIVSSCDGAPYNVSLNHAKVVLSATGDWVFTTLKEHEGAVEIIRGTAIFLNPIDFVLKNGDTIKMGTIKRNCYLTLGFFESK